MGIYVKTIFLFLAFISISCIESNTIILNGSENRFTQPHNAFHNEYYKNNNIETVIDINSNYKTVFRYNENGDLFKIDRFFSVEIDNEILDQVDSRSYELIYQNDLLKEILYQEGELLTHSRFDYEEGLMVKMSDFRFDELFFFTDYEYRDGLISCQKHTRLTSAGVRFGTSPIMFESKYVYNENGNLLRLDSRRVNEEFSEENPCQYSENSNLPNGIGKSVLSYTFFQ